MSKLDRLLLFYASYYTLHLMHFIIVILTHTYAYTLGHVEPRSKVQTEQAQVEAITNIFLSKASSGASHQLFLNFCFQLVLMLQLIVH
jgi:hypothetical protein